MVPLLTVLLCPTLNLGIILFLGNRQVDSLAMNRRQCAQQSCACQDTLDVIEHGSSPHEWARQSWQSTPLILPTMGHDEDVHPRLYDGSERDEGRS
jgi:hypothetical protein